MCFMASAQAVTGSRLVMAVDRRRPLFKSATYFKTGGRHFAVAASARQRPRVVQGALERRHRGFADRLLAKDHVEQGAQATRLAARCPEIFGPDVFKVIHRSDAQADVT